jgi:hypothetical protein
MNPFLSTVILLAGLTQSPSGLVVPSSNSSVSSSRHELAVSGRASNGVTTVYGDGFIGTASLPQQTRETVLVLPTPDLSAENRADLTEDMTVMCRIFDKLLAPARAPAGLTYDGQTLVLGRAFGPQGGGTQGLYLDGYGALFFVAVDYPLVPTEAQEPAAPKTDESTDTVWSATIREMTGQPGAPQPSEDKVPAYDPQKVENLQKAAIKTLVHASNIRMRRPQDMVTLVLGALDDGRTRYSRRGRGASAGRYVPAAAARAGQPAAFLVLRVAKADVDAFAKGQLTLAQFTEKVQSLWSPEDQGTPTTAPAPSTEQRR